VVDTRNMFHFEALGSFIVLRGNGWTHGRSFATRYGLVACCWPMGLRR
jgi:hypothetical protein